MTTPGAASSSVTRHHDTWRAHKNEGLLLLIDSGFLPVWRTSHVGVGVCVYSEDVSLFINQSCGLILKIFKSGTFSQLRLLANKFINPRNDLPSVTISLTLQTLAHLPALIHYHNTTNRKLAPTTLFPPTHHFTHHHEIHDNFTFDILSHTILAG